MNGLPLFRLLVLIVCRNRRDVTLRAIERIKNQGGNIRAEISVFDDASDDGTPEQINSRFPDVSVVHGSGNAFWNGGLHQLWSTVRDEPVDAFLWLNDDTLLDEDAFARLEHAWRLSYARHADNRFILVGSTRDSEGAISYGGYDVIPSPFSFKLVKVEPDHEALKPVQTFNGNVVLITKAVVTAIDLNDKHFFHNLGDVDYGLRARRAGIAVELLPNTLGLCEGNEPKRLQGFGSPRLSLMQQWRKVNTHHGLPFASWLRFTRRHSGAWWPLHFFLPYRHLLNITKLRGLSSNVSVEKAR